MKTKEIKKLDNEDLLSMEYNTTVFILEDDSGGVKGFELREKLRKEIEVRGLDIIPVPFNCL